MSRVAIAQPLPAPSAAPSVRMSKRSSSRSRLAIETPRLVLRASATGNAHGLDVTILVKPGLFNAGWIRFGLRDAVDREVELGFFLESSYRGRGLMGEAVRAAVPQALRVLGARTLYTILPADAPAAERVARVLGLSASSGRGPMRRFEKDLRGLI